jgi:PIN domain nuclease of toxin-antitoxin system
MQDTHAWLWWLQPNAREMPEGTRKFIAGANESVGVASVSCTVTYPDVRMTWSP